MNAPTTVLTAAIALIAVTGVARADVDAEIAGNAKIRGTLAPEGEVETLRFEATAGSALTLAIAAKKKAPLDFALTLFAPDGSVVSFDTAAKVIDKDKKVAVKKLPLAQSGSYRLEVKATGTGEYALKLKATPAKKIARTVALDAGTSGAAGIAAPPGSTITIRAAAPKGDASFPRIDSVGGLDVGDLPGPKGNKHTVKIVLGPDDGGDLMVALTNTAAGGGTVSLQATIKPPKAKAAKLDVRGVARGAPTGGETVVVRAVGVDGGAVGIDDEASRIDGTLITIPAGALVDPAAISISTSDPITPPDGSQQSAGEAVEFGPDGLEFESAATVVLPFDASSLPIDADPETDLQVLRETSDGQTEIIAPTSVDVDAGTVTVPVSGFSTFMAIVPRGSPDLTGREYWFLSFSIGLSPNPEGLSDSRGRDLDVSVGEIVFGDRGVFDDVTVTSDFRDITWFHDQDGAGSFPVQESGSETEFASWDYVNGRQTIALDFADEGPADHLLVSEDGTFLLGGTSDGEDEGEIYLDVGVRKAPNPTLASLAGTYYVAGGEYAAFGGQELGPLGVELSRFFGTLTLRADGSFTVQVSEHFSEFDPGNGFGRSRDSFRNTGNARIGTAEDGLFENTLIIEADVEPGEPEDDVDTFVMLPGAGGRVLLGTDLVALNDGQLILIAVRQGTGLTKSVLDGEYRSISLEIEPETYTTLPQQGGSVLIGDYSLCGYDTLLDFDGKGRATELFYSGACFRRDESQPSGILTLAGSGSDEGDSFSVKVASDGKLSEPGNDEPFVGAVLDDGTFYISIDDPKGPAPYYGFEVGVRPPLFDGD